MPCGHDPSRSPQPRPAPPRRTSHATAAPHRGQPRNAERSPRSRLPAPPTTSPWPAPRPDEVESPNETSTPTHRVQPMSSAMQGQLVEAHPITTNTLLFRRHTTSEAPPLTAQPSAEIPRSLGSERYGRTPTQDARS